MSLQLHPGSVLLLPFFCLAHCSGTEADNPVADVVVTPCKSSDEYDPAQLDRDFQQLRRSAPSTTGALGSASHGGVLGKQRAALTEQLAIPSGLSCVEWELNTGTLDVQIVNFSSSCSATLQGTAWAVAGRVTLALDDSSCEIARCGGCSYDTATSIALPAPGNSALVLELTRCGGSPVTHEWSLPLTDQPHGLLCRYSNDSAASGSAFAACEPSGGESSCGPGLDCVSNADEARCLPPCRGDAECPLSGGTRCEAGHCVPR